MNTNYVFDIETGPLPLGEVIHLQPKFEAPSNYKDPNKIEDYIREKQKAWSEDLALSPLTGEILVIGFKEIGQNGIMHLEASGNEKAMLATFWQTYRDTVKQGVKWVGHYVYMFDLPFIVRRSWHLGVDVPHAVVNNLNWWELGFVDTARVWALRGRNAEDSYISLDTLSRFLNTGKKTVDGEHFHRMYKADRNRGLAYLDQDLALTEANAIKLLPDLLT